MTVMMVVSAVAGWIWKTVRRLPETPAAADTPSLTIGAIIMSQQSPQNSSWAGKYASRRSELIGAIIRLATSPEEKGYALTRALGQLQLPELEEMYDELYEVIEGKSVTERDKKK